MQTADQVTAQVATEAIINDPHAYATSTMVSVLGHARAVGAPSFYVDQLAAIVERSAAGDRDW